jgi:endonuclease YncB( thermonuclease family)
VICEASTCTTATLLIWDGDSFLLAIDGRPREKIRIAKIDAPEIRGRCEAEAALAIAAKRELVNLLEAQRILLVRYDRDRYGRQLARLRAGKAEIGELMIARGLARRWDGHRTTWCSD